MRLIAHLSTLALLAVAGWLGYALWQDRQAPAEPPRSLAAALPAAQTGPAEQSAPSRSWPPLFGTVVVPEPQPPQPPRQPQPPAPPMPPIESMGYRLKGVVRNGDADWAIVTHPAGDLLLRVGDELTEGIKVDEIAEEGLWLTTGGARVLLGFESHPAQ